jgi:type II secretory pathway predicted ATPase ExeA
MYGEFLSGYGLERNPFKTNPDPSYLFLHERTRAAMDDMASAIQARKGLILLTGEAGTGKTTLLNCLMESLRLEKTPVSFIFNPSLEVSDLFELMLADFRIPLYPSSKGSILARLNQWLMDGYLRGRNAVLIVDEAQGLPIQVLEEIRMLLNEETPREKLLQVVLSGQPELEEKLRRPELRDIRQRVGVRCRTMPFSRKETDGYIQRRLSVAGATNQEVFLPEAIDAVHRYSRGIPRVMNLLCEYALVRASVSQVQPLPAYFVEEAARQLQFDEVMPVAGEHLAEALSPAAAGALESSDSVRAEIRPIAASNLPVGSIEFSTEPRACRSRDTVLETHSEGAAIVNGPPMPGPAFRLKRKDLSPIVMPGKASSDSLAGLKAELIAVKAAADRGRGGSARPTVVPVSRTVKIRRQQALLLSRMRQVIFEARRKMAFSALSSVLQRNVVCFGRWLQQPFPGLKVHRRTVH